MSSCKALARSSLSFVDLSLRRSKNQSFSSFSSFQPSPSLSLSSVLCKTRHLHGFHQRKPRTRNFSSVQAAALPIDPENCVSDTQDNTVERLLKNPNDVSRLMKMERKIDNKRGESEKWFPYLDKFRCLGENYLSSEEVLEAVEPHIMDVRKERFKGVIKNRSYSVCLVVEGLTDFGNVSATFRTADALGVQSVHVVSCDSSKRYRENRYVSKGAEKWLDIELWNTPKECFSVLKSRGYRIATTHVGMDAVSIYDIDWTCPTAIVVGNENKGISEEALALSDLHCSIPMKGMVDSFNVSVAAGILMHQAVCDRTARLGSHGDLTSEESRILLAEFCLRHSQSSISIANVYAKRKIFLPAARL